MAPFSVTDIFNRPPSIAEDTLQYTIYPPPNLTDKASVTTFAACFQSYVEILLSEFIWHRDAFELKVVPNPEDDDAWILEGRMRVGDCVDDEWCVVWLLREISSKWDVVIGVYDSDGEFLLIEAAEGLPSWVQPSNSENRVWIHSSRLHLIPLAHISPPSRKPVRRKLPGARDSDDEGDADDENNDYISPGDAVGVVRNRALDTYAPPEVEKIVWGRIAGYPSALKEHVHVTKAYIPTDVAKALSANPALVQKAVETFYTRDAIQLRAAHKMSRFPPNSSVLRSVKMTRTAYAQLVGQKFFPPKIFGRWEEREGSDEYRWKDIGMKIAVGFEMLYKESKNRQSVSAEQLRSSAEATKDALRNNPEYLTYIENLVSANYFQGEVEGSELWKTLENKAAATFVEVRRTEGATRQSFARQVDSAIANVSELPPQEALVEDSDAWLNIDEADFDSMLARSQGKAQKSKQGGKGEQMDVDNQTEDDLATFQAGQLKDLASKVEDFIEGEGDIEGARFEDEKFSDEELSDFSDNDDEASGDEPMEDDSPPSLTDAERRAAMDKLVAPLEQSEYGKMPASYSKSQKVKPTTIDNEVVEDTPSRKPKDKAETQKTESESPSRRIRAPIIPRNQYDGVDSDDETDEEEMDDEDEEDHPQVVGDVEIDMDEEEEEFLEFSRQALGISDEHWNDIIKDRKARGAFLPASAMNPKKTTAKAPESTPTTNVQTDASKAPRVPQPGPRPNANPELDSFEAVMQALDQELAKQRPQKAGESKGSGKSKGKEKAEGPVDVDFDIDAIMEDELRAVLERDDSDEEMERDSSTEYNLIKNFLESFKSQGGLSGPVGNLAGRLQPDWKLPRDRDS
ncbi:hypothetical protein EST38_g11315 [Candolleomyces aberdarensis]|uniref:SGT1-domain-containing protein n=1 Tax=Candolleomyces aberdarensis TaxID=2316362 RepID=A0A4Q2D5U3_9AGAR|nr:hypothetical protein EST38_g11315 [Candolleomyces aberdarensis]